MIAPDAQLISLHVGDVRLESMETSPDFTPTAAHVKHSQMQAEYAYLDLKSVNFNSYQNVPDVYSKTSTLTMFSLERKDTKMLYIAVPDCKHAFAKEFKASDVLVGKLEFTGSIEGGQYKVIYTVPSLKSDDGASNLAPLLIKVKFKRKAGHPGNAMKATEKFLTEFSFTANNMYNT
ncbi:hypothetical protein G6F56_003799 [Rhizopus delemar]|nr:hypothetical protein G6F56_003799 [Rhizopus delemar]